MYTLLILLVSSYNPAAFGPSGNITVNGTATFGCGATNNSELSLSKRGIGAGNESGVELNTPPYAIHNGWCPYILLTVPCSLDALSAGNGRLSIHTLATNATHAGGYVELDVHNLWGLMEEKATHIAVQEILPGKRPFLISRSTFPSSGKWSGHWVSANLIRHSSAC